jgi:hypothetical protein
MLSLLDRPASAIAFLRYGSSNSTYRVEVVVSGRIAATAPLPCDASDFNCVIAEKSLVNDVADSDGAAAADELLDVGAAAALLLAELVLLDVDELPHAASTTLVLTASTATTALPFRKCMKTPPPSLWQANDDRRQPASGRRRPVN